MTSCRFPLSHSIWRSWVADPERKQSLKNFPFSSDPERATEYAICLITDPSLTPEEKTSLILRALQSTITLHNFEAFSYMMIIPEFIACIDMKNKYTGSSFLMRAIVGDNRIARFILNSPLYTNYSSDFEGNTPLHYAASSGNKEMFILLYNHERINKRALNSDGKTAIAVSARYQREIWRLAILYEREKINEFFLDSEWNLLIKDESSLFVHDIQEFLGTNYLSRWKGKFKICFLQQQPEKIKI